MKTTVMKIKVPKYDGKCFSFIWEDYFEIRCLIKDNSVCIEANKDGLISFARLMLEMAQDTIPEYYHFHLDGYTEFEEGSSELIVQKI